MSSSDEPSWISWFCGLPGNEFLCEVEENFIIDRFNLTDLSDEVEEFQKALNLILDIETDMDLLEGSSTKISLIESCAEKLYGLIHARYILTNDGILRMIEKFRKSLFGTCPRMYCNNQPLLPVGMSDKPGEGGVKLYCAKCVDVYLPNSFRHSQLDGAYIGTGFPQMLFMVHPELRPDPPTEMYVPRLFGFCIHSSAYEVQPEP